MGLKNHIHPFSRRSHAFDSIFKKYDYSTFLALPSLHKAIPIGNVLEAINLPRRTLFLNMPLINCNLLSVRMLLGCVVVFVILLYCVILFSFS